MIKSGLKEVTGRCYLISQNKTRTWCVKINCIVCEIKTNCFCLVSDFDMQPILFQFSKCSKNLFCHDENIFVMTLFCFPSCNCNDCITKYYIVYLSRFRFNNENTSLFLFLELGERIQNLGPHIRISCSLLISFDSHGTCATNFLLISA